MQKEKAVEHSILDYLIMNKIFCFKINTTGIWDAKRQCYRRPNSKHIIKGVADILGVLPDGKFLAIEVKSKGRKSATTLEQKAFLNNINVNGGIGFVADCLQDVQNNLKDYIKIGFIQ